MRYLSIGLALVAGLLVAGCDFAKFIPGTSTIQVGQDGEAIAEPSAQQRLGDEIFGVVKGHDGRTARLALVMATYSELAADRVTRFDQDQAAATLGHLVELRVILAGFEGKPDSVFVETDLRYASLALAKIVIDSGLDRGRGLVGKIVGGLDISGIRERASVAARQAALTDALLADVRAAVKRMGNDPGAIAAIKTAAMNRFTKNENRIKSLLGA